MSFLLEFFENQSCAPELLPVLVLLELWVFGPNVVESMVLQLILGLESFSRVALSERLLNLLHAFDFRKLSFAVAYCRSTTARPIPCFMPVRLGRPRSRAFFLVAAAQLRHVSYGLNSGWGGPIRDYLGFWGGSIKGACYKFSPVLM